MVKSNALKNILWLSEAGVDEVIEFKPVNRFRQKASPAPVQASTAAPASQTSAPIAPAAAIAKARKLADAATTLGALKQAVMEFNGCGLKKTATNTVFADGNPESPLMAIGEAPGAEEDKQGIPFCGLSGKLLDQMFLSIGRSREHFYITNTLFWRPPGNRQPTPEELAICEPFVQKHIALVGPKLLVLVGGTAAKSVLNNSTGITRLRGKEFSYTNPYLEGRSIPVMVTFHPSFLLRQPMQKKQAWQDMLAIKQRINA